jgi:catechol 2,3-dioxygenase-like lactoylglutathione lyase family enzyme
MATSEERVTQPVSRHQATVTGPDFLALQVADLDRAARFYTERLGLRPVPQSPPGAVLFATEPIPFAERFRSARSSD